MSDLIERLRRYRTSGVRMASPSICKDAADQLEAQQAEVARLREALCQCAEAPFSGWTIAQGIALAALEQKP